MNVTKVKKSILIVEDDDSMRVILNSLFKKDYNIILAVDGLHASYLLSEGNIPDLIISDVNMPNMNGTEFVNMLQKSGLYRDIPIIALTGHSNSFIVNDDHKKIIDIVPKPFDPNNLIEKVSEILNVTRSTKKASV